VNIRKNTKNSWGEFLRKLNRQKVPYIAYSTESEEKSFVRVVELIANLRFIFYNRWFWV
jgi:hypothetical protein